MLEVVARDVKELADEPLEATSLVEGDAHVPAALLGGHVGHLVEQREVSDDRGERRPEVMGKIGDEVVLSRRLLGEGALVVGNHAPYLGRREGELLISLGKRIARADVVGHVGPQALGGTRHRLALATACREQVRRHGDDCHERDDAHAQPEEEVLRPHAVEREAVVDPELVEVVHVEELLRHPVDEGAVEVAVHELEELCEGNCRHHRGERGDAHRREDLTTTNAALPIVSIAQSYTRTPRRSVCTWGPQTSPPSSRAGDARGR